MAFTKSLAQKLRNEFVVQAEVAYQYLKTVDG